jgi:hypothetical protein
MLYVSPCDVSAYPARFVTTVTAKPIQILAKVLLFENKNLK